jgi:hypothetical protein
MPYLIFNTFSEAVARNLEVSSTRGVVLAEMLFYTTVVAEDESAAFEILEGDYSGLTSAEIDLLVDELPESFVVTNIIEAGTILAPVEEEEEPFVVEGEPDPEVED